MDNTERIASLETEIETRYNELSRLRAQQEPVPIVSYVFAAADGRTVSLADLFGDKERLLLVHNMGRQCPYCTVWADGFSDSYHRLAKKMAFVVTSKETTDAQERNIKERGWTFPMVSSSDNLFLEDLQFVNGDTLYPGLAYLSRDREGNVFYHGKHLFGSGDNFGMLWHMLDLAGQWDEEEYAMPAPQAERQAR